MKRPPWWSSACAAARDPGNPDGDRAARDVARWADAFALHGPVADVLSRTETEGTTTTQVEDGETRTRVATTVVRLQDGERVIVPGARAMPAEWIRDTGATGLRVFGCANAWYSARDPKGRRGAYPIRCGAPWVCPCCMVARANALREPLQAALSELIRRGYHVVLLTLTQRTDEHDPGPKRAPGTVWTRRDARCWGAAPEGIRTAAGGEGRAAPGESLSDAWERFQAAERDTRDGRGRMHAWTRTGGTYRPRAAAWWWQTVVASIGAIEATQLRGVRVNGVLRRVTAIRWHVHGHDVLILDPSAIDSADVEHGTAERADGTTRPTATLKRSAPWFRSLVCRWGMVQLGARWRRWRAAGRRTKNPPPAGRLNAETWASIVARPYQLARRVTAHAQRCDVLSALPDDELGDAIAEVIKYPGKVSEMTEAGIAEFAVTMPTRRVRRVGGALHGSTLLGGPARALAHRDAAARGYVSSSWDTIAPELATQQPDHAHGNTFDVDGWVTARVEALHARGALGDVSDADRYIDRERGRARIVDVAAARLEALRVAHERAMRRPVPDFTRGIPALGEDAERPYLLTIDRVRRAVRAATYTVDAWTPPKDRQLGVELERVDLLQVRDELTTWRPRDVEPDERSGDPFDELAGPGP